MALSKSESDVILNRANVALARSQRLVASWLPEKTGDELTSAKSEEELQREEDEIFTAVPETLGVGAPLPEKAADGSWNRTELSSNDQLRKQLLGRNYDKFMKASAAAKQASAAAKITASAAAGKTASGASSAVQEEDDQDDDEDGRVSMVGKKKRRVGQGRAAQTGSGSGSGSGVTPVSTPGEGEDAGAKGENGVVQTDAPVKQAPSKGRKKATSYLDELLAERSKKRKKR